MNIFDVEVVRNNTLKYFNGDQLATTVWMSKYNLKNDAGDFVENGPESRFRTMASEIIRADKAYEDVEELTEETVFKMLIDQHFLPGGSIIFGIGNPYSVISLGNCFVISGNKEDSYGSILKNDQEIVQIAKRRGGVGNDLSHIRPKGFAVKNAAKTSTGMVSFATRFSNSTREVGQDGRRGALMLSVHINHPDALDFIMLKDDDTSVTGANISVKVTNEFMRAVESDGIHQLRYPVDTPFKQGEFNLGETYKLPDGSMFINVKARSLFDKLAEVNWRRAEPGLLFWDTIEEESPADRYDGYKSESTNPCGEIPLSPYDSCRLLALNITSYVINPFTGKARFDYEKFKAHAIIVTRIMDNIIDLEIEKLKAIISKIMKDPESIETKSTELTLWENVLEATINGRRAGISLIGHGDMLAMLRMQYGSKESTDFVTKLHRLHATYTYDESIRLACIRGEFPVFEAGIDGGPFLNRIGRSGIPRRNIALLTIPPSGTISILFNNQSSGIEPVFAPWYSRRRKVNPDEAYDFKDKSGDCWQTYDVFHNNFLLWAKVNGIAESDLAANKEEYLKKSPYHLATSHFIDPIQKVKMQGSIQKYVDHSISVTINLPKTATVQEIKDIYITAWKAGCKGSTIYRDGSRSGVLNVTEEVVSEFRQHHAPKRPKDLPCDIFHASINSEKYVVMVGIMEDKPYETFAIKVTDGVSMPNSMSRGLIRKHGSKRWGLLTIDKDVVIENIIEEFDIPEYGTVTKMASLALRTGAEIKYVVKVLNNNTGIITDYAKVIARQLKKYIVKEEDQNSPCPNCGRPMIIEGGCKQCKNEECGYGQCG